MAKPDSNYNNKDFKFRGAIILKLYGGKCSVCSQEKDWMEIHHIDKQNDNNDYNNLIPVCKDCHMVVHSKRFRISLVVAPEILSYCQQIENIFTECAEKLKQ